MCQKGSGTCIGGGEVLYDLYYNDIHVGEVTYTNGTQPGEEAGICTGLKIWYKTVEDIPEKYTCVCKRCGEVYFSASDQYRNEWPNSSDMAESYAYENHMHECGEL